SPRPDRLAPPVPTTSSTIFSGVEPGPPATDTAPDRHTRMPKSAAKRRQPRRLPPLTSPMKHRGLCPRLEPGHRCERLPADPVRDGVTELRPGEVHGPGEEVRPRTRHGPHRRWPR